MRDYFPRHGRSSRLAHHMMKHDRHRAGELRLRDEADAVDKIRTAYGVSSIVTALFAASPFADGRPTGYKSFRAAIWLETDEDRCGLLPFVFEPSFCFRDYVEWALDVPMFFVVRDGAYRPVGGMTFRRFMAEGFEGETATMRDWEIHLSTLFPEVRLKRYIELRGADAGPMPMAVALGALWRGLLDDHDARAAAWELVAKHVVRRARGPAARGAARGAEARLRRPAAAGAGARAICDRRRGPGAAAGRRGRSAAARPAVGLRDGGARPPTTLLDDFAAAAATPPSWCAAKLGAFATLARQ